VEISSKLVHEDPYTPVAALSAIGDALKTLIQGVDAVVQSLANLPEDIRGAIEQVNLSNSLADMQATSENVQSYLQTPARFTSYITRVQSLVDDLNVAVHRVSAHGGMSGLIQATPGVAVMAQAINMLHVHSPAVYNSAWDHPAFLSYRTATLALLKHAEDRSAYYARFADECPTVITRTPLDDRPPENEWGRCWYYDETKEKFSQIWIPMVGVMNYVQFQVHEKVIRGVPGKLGYEWEPEMLLGCDGAAVKYKRTWIAIRGDETEEDLERLARSCNQWVIDTARKVLPLASRFWARNKFTSRDATNHLRVFGNVSRDRLQFDQAFARPSGW
jgi:hypothetical protein